MNAKKEANRTNSNEARSDERTTNDDRSSLDRLAAFTKRILRVPKEALTDDTPERTVPP